MSSRFGSGGAVVIGSRLEPLVDRFLIEETRGAVRLELGTPVERELVFVHDRPWEGNRSGLTTIIRDGAVCRMYYCGSQLDLHDGGYRIPHNYTCYAQSADGLAWTRPDLGLVDLPGGEPNNAILTGQPPLTFTPFLDTNPDCAPDQRFKALALKYDPPPRALYGFASADGIRWSQIGDRPLITTGYFDSQNIAFWDATRREYRAYVRDFHGSRDAAAREVAVRDVRTCTSPDFLAWTGAAVAVVRTGTVRGDLHQPDQPLLPRAAPVRRPAHALRHRPRPRDGAQRAHLPGAGAVRHQLHRHRPDDQPRRKHLRPVGRGVHPPRAGSEGPLALRRQRHRAGDASDAGRWRHHRAVAVRRRGRLGPPVAAAPVRATGRRLRLAPRGRRRRRGADPAVDLRRRPAGTERLHLGAGVAARGGPGSGGRTIDGFAEDDCLEVFGDDTEQEVRWQGAPDLGRLAGTPVRLRFTMRDADLYSLRFRDGGAG